MATVRLSEESAPQFTPGPWSIRTTPKSYDGSRNWFELLAGETVLAEIYGDGPEWDEVSQEEAAANARLIAAALDTYRCTKLLESLCVWLLHAFGPDSPAGREAGFRLREARAALASARGEQGK